MMSNTSKRKGTRVENKIVKLFENLGIKARRQPMSGSLQDFPHDVKVELLGGLHIEVKARKNGKGFATIKKWKGSADLLVMVEDYDEPGVYIDWRLWKQIAKILKDNG
jgi:Holliday junction resolvase|tara:strand:- start:121 stop:444 length:324 start_codon:yes stop_codon:yes gene_type:complete